MKSAAQSFFWENAHRNGLYKNWEELKEKFPYLHQAIKLLKKRKHNNLKALDIGCSTGKYSLVLAREYFSVTGIDISKAAIYMARAQIKRRKIAGTKFMVSDFMKYVSGTMFDFILDFSVFTHIHKKNWDKYLLNVKKHLKSEGLYLISLWSDSSSRVYGTDLDLSNTQEIILKTKNGDFYNYFFAKDEIYTLFSKYFRIIWIKESKLASFDKIQPGSDLSMFFILCSLP